MSRKRLTPEERADHTRRRKQIDRKRYYGKTANLYPPRPWTAEDERMVMEHSIPDSELSVKIERSLKSIQEKRRRLRNAEAKSEE